MGHQQEFSDTDRRLASPAAKLGITPAEYAAHLAAGEKWCWWCGAWHAREEFGANAANPDGLSSLCSDGKRTYNRRRDRLAAQRRRKATVTA